ncbi:MAG: topoisomerase protein [Parcubacteria group bacterium GW2011_GWA1_42_7]|nr:MAG: topoisomerase protein [Parcubacteria group bacterium GW2011_GWA1_42_7]
MNLVIVESPTKAKTIQRFLPSGEFIVKSSFGHVRDLPRKELGVDIENGFKPKYVVPMLARKKVTDLKKSLQKSDKVILATDEDREGEAIAWHLEEALALKKNKKQTERIVFHEITKNAINEALKNPRQIDMSLVDAQQARRILDRIVGYQISPFLWKKVAKGLSAGRVQSVAVRLIVEREREILAFVPEEYWTISAFLKKKGTLPEEAFEASLIKKDGEAITKLGIKSQKEADEILEKLRGAQYKVAKIESKESHRYPSPPFTTSTLQQDAAKKLGFSAKQTMQIAQQLYEGVELGSEGSIGLISYMRTDSQNLAKEALIQIRQAITAKFGPEYLPEKEIFYKTKSKGAQEAHEAIRPTDIGQEPEAIKNFLTQHQFKLYRLIWKRTLACQMNPAVLSLTAVDIKAESEKSPSFEPEGSQSLNGLTPLSKGGNGSVYTFRSNGTQIKFDGFLKVYENKVSEVSLPSLSEGEDLDLEKISPDQHFTEPPARFSEAMLIKTLEENGIGRPSTYAPTISTIVERNYTQKNEQKRFFPTEIGFTVNDILVEHFPQIVDLNFTAKMEEELDEIAEGQKKWQPVMEEFYAPFKENLDKKYKEVKQQKAEPEPTDKICPECNSPIVIRTSRFGKFYACSNFPKCRHTENIKSDTGMPCPKCVEGQVIERRTKRGKIFFGCSLYPKCDFASWDKPTGQKCPRCGSFMVVDKKGNEKCGNKECKNKE